MENLTNTQLEDKIQVLKGLCQNLDPYEPISSEDEKVLKDLGINELDDPFALTNQLIFALENAIEKLEKSKGTIH